MKNVVSTKMMRESDKKTINEKTSGVILMGKAAKGLMDSVSWENRIAIICGSGNNAGDGYALALLLNEKKLDVTVIRLFDRLSADSAFYYEKVLKNHIKVIFYDKDTDFQSYQMLVDCIYGTGFHGELDALSKEVILKINESNCFVVSCDINSGLNGDNGLAKLAVQSDLTVSIGTMKYGHFLNQAKDYCSRLTNVDIGISLIQEEAKLLEISDVKDFFKTRKHFSNKGTYGYIGIMGGCLRYPGAIKLANLGQTALYAGCGVSKVLVPEEMASMLYPQVLETTIYPMPSKNGNMIFDPLALEKATKGLKAMALGVGWGTSKDNEKILSYLLEHLTIPFLIDADGLNTLASLGISSLLQTKAQVLLTPHLKEMSRLSGYSVAEIQENPVFIVKEFVEKYPCTLLLKGPTTIVANKDSLYFVDKGTPGMATAGSGDVLTGILTGILGYSDKELALSAAVGAYVNGLAGEYAAEEYGDFSMVSSDTARCVSKVMKLVTTK